MRDEQAIAPACTRRCCGSPARRKLAISRSTSSALRNRDLARYTATFAIAGSSSASVLLTLAPTISIVMAGLALVGVGTFFSQAVATGFTGRAGGDAKAAAGGLYLAAYYSGGICGALLLGLVYDTWAWPGCVAVTGAAFVLMAAIPFVAWQGKALDKTQGKAITRG